MEDKTWDDRGAVLCEELQRLPDRYRAAVVVCDLEGLTQERAAQLLGWPAGTVRSRLARGRQRLRDQLTRRGLAPSVVPALPWLSGNAPRAAVPATLAEITTDAAAQLVANRAATSTMASVGSLTEGVLRVMFWSKLKVITAGILAGGLLAGTALLAYWSAGLQPGRSPAPQAEDSAKDGAGAKHRPTVPALAGAQSLSPTAKARLDVAKMLRDQMFESLRVDPTRRFTDFLPWLNRYDEVVEEVKRCQELFYSCRNGVMLPCQVRALAIVTTNAWGKQTQCTPSIPCGEPLGARTKRGIEWMRSRKCLARFEL